MKHKASTAPSQFIRSLRDPIAPIAVCSRYSSVRLRGQTALVWMLTLHLSFPILSSRAFYTALLQDCKLCPQNYSVSDLYSCDAACSSGQFHSKDICSAGSYQGVGYRAQGSSICRMFAWRLRWLNPFSKLHCGRRRVEKSASQRISRGGFSFRDLSRLFPKMMEGITFKGKGREGQKGFHLPNWCLAFSIHYPQRTLLQNKKILYPIL